MRSDGKKRFLGEYELLERLGRGTMGVVFLARHPARERPVAVKVLAPRLAKNEDYVRRFVREAQAAARLNHTNVIGALEVGDTGKYRYFVMEYVEGPTIADLLARGGAMAEERAVGIVIQVARGLDHAHRCGFVHRDVKPANVILTADGTAKLCDLGLSKEIEEGGGDTQEGQSMGTPDYISPEQARGDAAIDIRTDIHALGATFYHMVTGQVPYAGATPAVVMTKHLTEPVPEPRAANPVVSPACARVIRKMMAKHGADRYQTPEELIVDLERIDLERLRNGQGKTGIPVLKSRRGRTRRRRRR